MKSLLVALDETPGAEAAVRCAQSLAVRHSAKLTGVGVLDVPHLTAPVLVPHSSGHRSFDVDMSRLMAAQDRNSRLLRAFLLDCRERKIRANILVRVGTAAEELRGAAAVHDAVVIGQDSDLQGEAIRGLAATVELLLKRNPRPLIVTPSDAIEPSRLLVAYDGSTPASRALQLLALLNLAVGCDVHVLSVAPDRRAAERAACHAAAYLKLHGANAVGRPVVSEADPAEVIIDETKAVDANMLVMGAYGHRGWRDLLLGSCTTRILNLCPATLFICQ